MATKAELNKCRKALETLCKFCPEGICEMCGAKAILDDVMYVTKKGDEWHWETGNGDTGWTSVVNLEMYDCMTPEEYIKEWCLDEEM